MKVLFAIVLAILLCACHNGYIIEHITFKDSITDVQDSLIQFQKMLGKIASDEYDTNVYFGAQTIFINGKNIGGIHIKTFNEDSLFSKFTIEEKQEFLGLILYLKRNQINCAFKELEKKIWFFDYKKYDDFDYTTERKIIIYHYYDDTVGLSKYFVVTDRKENLLLLAHSSKDASLQTKMGKY